MIIRVRRNGTAGATVKIKLPINATARAIVDSEVAKLRNCVIPVIGATLKGRPYVVGSAVALTYRDAAFLVTADHVMRDHDHEPLFIFASDRLTRPFQGTFQVDEEVDLAAKRLSRDEVDWLSHIPFLPEESLGTIEPTGKAFYATVVGYPATAAKRTDRITLDTCMEAYSSWGKCTADGRVDVVFDKKEGSWGEHGHSQPRDQYGKSGGAIFGIELESGFGLPTPPVKLAGIATRWQRKDKIIRGGTTDRLIPLLQMLIGGPED